MLVKAGAVVFHVGAQVVKLHDQGAHPLVEHDAGGGEEGAVGVPHEQLHVQFAFQLGDCLADGLPGNEQLAGGADKTACVRH